MKKEKILRIIVTVFVALAIAGLAFGGGFLTCKFTRKKEVTSFEWALKTIRDNYYKDIPDDVLLNGSLKGLSALCLDQHSAYYTAEEYEELVASNSGNRKGIGISYTNIKEEWKDFHPEKKSGAYVEMVVGNSPAYRAGLRAGEFIEGIRYNGNIFDMTLIESVPDGEDFTLITDKGEYTVSKQDYISSYVTMSTKTTDYSIYYDYQTGEGYWEDKEGGIDYLPDGAAYMRLDQFYGNATNEMAALIEQFNATGCTSLILDLRGNGGGYVDVMCEMSSIFTGQLPNRNRIAMQAIYKDGTREAYAVKNVTTKAQQLKAGTRVSVLADNGTASASEALIGVLVENGVIGYEDIYLSKFSDGYVNFIKAINDAPDMDVKNCRSYGKGIMQTTFRHPITHEALKLTTAKIYWPNGEISIHDVGLNTSMGCKTVDTDWDVTYGDEQLRLAVEAIYGTQS